jgi:hypothetical protein
VPLYRCSHEILAIIQKKPGDLSPNHRA